MQKALVCSWLLMLVSLYIAFEAGATINEAEGWVQNLPQQAVQDQISQYQQQVEVYINNQNPDATVGDLLGLQDLRIIPSRPLSAGLPTNKSRRAGATRNLCNRV